MAVTHSYTVDLDWETGRTGLISAEELSSKIEVVTPPQFPGGVAGKWSPEHLFVASINSCLMTTFLAIAENSKLEYQGFRSRATGKLELADGKYMITEVTLSPVLSIANVADTAKAERVLQKSEAACLISNSVKSRIHFYPQVRVTTTIEG